MAKKNFLVDIDLNKNQLLNFKLQNLATHPTVTVGTDEGVTYWNTTDNTTYTYTGVGAVWSDTGAVELKKDLTPQLGGNLDLNNKGITDTFGNIGISINGNITDGTGYLKLGGGAYWQMYSGVGEHATLNGTLGTFSNDFADIQMVTNDTVTSGFNALHVNVIETQVRTGQKNLINLKLTNISKFRVDTAGNVILAGTVDGRDIATDGTKLDGIEASADVTDATNVNAAGAVMNTDTTTAAMAFVLDEDAMTSNSATKIATQQSIKAYVDSAVATANAFTVKGGIDCSTNPNYPAANAGDAYRVTAAGKIGGASGKVVQIGDLLICFTDSTVTGTQAAVGAEWIIEQNNLEAASTTLAGYVKLANQTETDGGFNNVTAVTPGGLGSYIVNKGITSKKVFNVGDGTATSFSITHSFGTLDFISKVYRNVAPFDEVTCTIEHLNTNIATVIFNVAPTVNQYRVVLIG